MGRRVNGQNTLYTCTDLSNKSQERKNEIPRIVFGAPPPPFASLLTQPESDVMGIQCLVSHTSALRDQNLEMTTAS